MSDLGRLREPRNAAIIGIALALAVLAFFLLTGDDDDSDGEATGGAVEASVDELRDVASAVDHPVYWVGEDPSKVYELTVTDDGNIFVRYLDPETPVGSQDILSLTIGTYPVPDAYNATRAQAKQKGSITGKTPDGGFVLTSRENPNSVYIAYPGSDYQIEVYDPDPKRALQVASSGEVEPVS